LSHATTYHPPRSAPPVRQRPFAPTAPSITACIGSPTSPSETINRASEPVTARKHSRRQKLRHQSRPNLQGQAKYQAQAKTRRLGSELPGRNPWAPNSLTRIRNPGRQAMHHELPNHAAYSPARRIPDRRPPVAGAADNCLRGLPVVGSRAAEGLPIHACCEPVIRVGGTAAGQSAEPG
jgi:hypothetical protein